MSSAQESPVSHAPLSSVRSDSLAAFRLAINSSFVPLEIAGGRSSSFGARLSSAAADGVTFTEVRAAPHTVERTEDAIANGGSGYYKVSLLLSGSSILVQDGRELVQQAGDLTVYDTSRPYSLMFTEEFRNLIMMFPKDRLDLPIPFTEQLTAAPFPGDSGLAPVVSAFLSQFPSQLANLPDRVRTKLAHTSLDLVSTLFSEVLDTDATARDPHQALLRRICEHIDERLADPTLSPTSIAAAHYVSTRHLHALFREMDTTVSTWIRERRLERCRADLLDPVLADRTVGALAARWGFIDAAHFSRIFKAAYGRSPSELRRLGLGSA